MERNANYAMVGVASVILLVGLAAFVLWLAKVQFAQDYDIYDILFDGPVRGLSTGGEVHFNGIKVGEVTKIALDPTNASRVIARVKVTSDVPIRTDSFATLEPEGITGVNYVQITAGTPSRPLLKTVTPSGEAPVIRSQKSALSDLLEGGGTVLQRSVEALDRVNRVLSDNNIKTLTTTLNDLEAVTAELKANRAVIGDADATLQSIDATSRKIGELSDSTNGLINGDAKTALKNLSDAADELKGTAHNANDMLSKLNGPTADFANTGLPQMTSAIASLQTATDTLNRVLNEAERSPTGLLAKPKGKEIEVRP
ncbi:MAG TPA: MlaD family protein [Caulobacteraceae bacterium]|nr:MlaD family protein [Caulobacteraceae bacterium]